MTPTAPSADAERAELLAIADADELAALAEACIDAYGDPVMVTPPETGLVVLQVREPVCAERFHLGEAVVTRAEVRVAGRAGWAMRIGHDRVATLAAAICDAVGAGTGPLSEDVAELCARTRRREAERTADEWRELAPTVVEFEELV